MLREKSVQKGSNIEVLALNVEIERKYWVVIEKC